MKLAFFIGLLFIIHSCTAPKTSEVVNKAKIDQEVRLMFDNYHKDIAKGGLLTEFKYLDNSEDFFWVPPGYYSPLSYDSVRLILIENDKALEALNFRWDTLRIIPLSNNLASYTGIVVGETQDTTGMIYPVSIIESGTVIRRTDGWKLLCGQSANTIDID